MKTLAQQSSALIQIDHFGINNILNDFSVLNFDIEEDANFLKLYIKKNCNRINLFIYSLSLIGLWEFIFIDLFNLKK